MTQSHDLELTWLILFMLDLNTPGVSVGNISGARRCPNGLFLIAVENSVNFFVLVNMMVEISSGVDLKISATSLCLISLTSTHGMCKICRQPPTTNSLANEAQLAIWACLHRVLRRYQGKFEYL